MDKNLAKISYILKLKYKVNKMISDKQKSLKIEILRLFYII